MVSGFVSVNFRIFNQYCLPESLQQENIFVFVRLGNLSNELLCSSHNISTSADMLSVENVHIRLWLFGDILGYCESMSLELTFSELALLYR